MVTIGKENRYYIRRNFQSEPMTEDEIRSHYSRSVSLKEVAERSYEEIKTSLAETQPASQLVTIPAVYNKYLVDPREFPARYFKLNQEGTLSKYEYEYWSNYNLEENRYVGKHYDTIRSIIYFSGICEHCYNYTKDEEPYMFKYYTLVEDLNDFLLHYGRVYETVGYFGPLYIYYNLFGTRGNYIYHDRRYRSQESNFSYNTTTYVDTLINNPLLVVHEIMDYLWIFFGRNSGCPFFTQNSELIENWNRGR